MISFIFSSVAFAQNIRDIKPPVLLPPNYFFLIVVGIVILVTALFFAFAFFLKKIKRHEQKQEVITRKSAYEIATEALESLRLKDLPGQGRIKEYYALLSDIVRRYLENRFSLRAPEMTTEEFLCTLGESNTLSGQHKNLLKDFLRNCDLVKFARYEPGFKECEDVFNSAKRLTEETKEEIKASFGEVVP